MERYELPDGWEWKTLGECCDVNRRDPALKNISDDTMVSFVPMAAVDADQGVIAKPVDRPFSEVRKGFTPFSNGDVIFAKITPSMENGKAAIANGLTNGFGFGSTEFHVMRPKESVIAGWVFLFIRQQSFRDEAKGSFAGTAGQLRVPEKFILNTDIPLAPVPEQQRILSKIESLFEQSRAARTALTRVPVLMAQIRRAVLASAFRGELVEPDSNDESAASLLERIREVRKQSISKKNIEPVDTSDLPELPEGWIWVRFEELLAELKNGHFSKTPAFEPPGIPILRISAVRPLSVKLDEPRFFRGELEDVSQYELRNGDLLFTRYNGSLNLVGVCGLVRSLNEVMIYPDKLIRARFFENTVSPAYLEAYFSTALPRSIIEDKTKSSAGQQGISGKDLKDVPVPLPPLGEQQRIVAKIEALFAQADIIEQAAFVSLRRAEQINQSILARAFRGELG
ncbi:Type-1 restriction enzyme EcoKI specificity protein [Anaerolineales bacterium]|nr:Type-1 restriction enzyme EcoKI specificity protein [Anaerolineales bacterium]